MTPRITQLEMEQRLVRYADLRPCTTAFLDTKTPGSQEKENFTIIGPGVAENPDQYVHINIPHGFNIGGARQTPGCVNSQHSHETAEVFVIHSGKWRFLTGHKCEGPYVDLNPGDTISIPIGVFRGFENVGTEMGFMFSVLGGDDPGRVTWAPAVFAAAAEHGLVLLEGGRLIDTSREEVPAGAIRIAPTTEAAADSMKMLDQSSLERCVARAVDLVSGGGLSEVPGFAEYPVIGAVNVAEHMPAGPISWPHGFQVRALHIDGGAGSPAFIRNEEEVIFVHRAQIRVDWPGGSLLLSTGDTLTIPVGVGRSFVNDGTSTAVIYIVRGGDHPHAARPA